MWQDESIFYQIYPLGFCGALNEQDSRTVGRIKKVIEWADYMSGLSIDAVLFNPVFESDYHGYDTRDYSQIDRRLGTNQDFKEVVEVLHQRGIKVLLDGVFNHVGRGFWAFQDVLEKREASVYKDWFYIHFGQDNHYGDGFGYEGWEGHYELVKLNLNNQAVVEHLLGCVRGWVDEFDIDGLRLDVAYCVDKQFLRELRMCCDNLKPDFFLMGEMLFGDYTQIVNQAMLHSCTNYECYKGIYSSLNDMNFFEISHSLNRQFGPEEWTIYKGLHLFTFLDNHDVSRIATMLNNKKHLSLAYDLLFGIPGIPCIYYGSEWGVEGDKKDGDEALRPEFIKPEHTELGEHIMDLIAIRKESKALSYGSFKNIAVTNRQFIFERRIDTERILVAINGHSESCTLDVGIEGVRAVDLLTDTVIEINRQITLPPYSAGYWKVL